MGSCPKVTWPFNHVVLWDQPISIVEVLMVTKVGKLVTGHEGLPFMLLHPLVTWCCQITWQTNTYLHYRNIYDHKTRQGGGLLWQLFIMWVYYHVVFVRSHDKLKTLYLHYRNAYGHKAWQYDDLLWVTSTHKIIWPYNHIVV